MLAAWAISASLAASVFAVASSAVTFSRLSCSVWVTLPPSALTRPASSSVTAVFSRSSALSRLIRLVLAGDLAQLRGHLGLELVDAHLEPARVERELGPQMVLVGLDFGHRHRDGVFEAALGEADGALMDEGNQDDRQQTRDEKATPEIHDRFDHGRHSCLPPRFTAESEVSEPADARIAASATRHTPSPGNWSCPASRVRRPRSERVPDQNGFQVDCGVNFK